VLKRALASRFPCPRSRQRRPRDSTRCFDYDKSDIRADAKESLTKNAEFLNLHRDIRFAIEGHCDERGSAEYNLGLGDRRATAAKKYMVSLGIAEDRIQTTSYGKERPFCSEHTEACWQQNRRAHFVMVR
jgi:peptidoglycan-associated lipoprotein